MSSRIAILTGYGPAVVVGLVAIYSLHKASQTDGSHAERACGFGLVLLAAAITMIVRLLLKERGPRERELEDQVCELRAEVRDLASELDAVKHDVHSRLAATSFLEALDRTDVHNGRRPHITLHSSKDSS